MNFFVLLPIYSLQRNQNYMISYSAAQIDDHLHADKRKYSEHNLESERKSDVGAKNNKIASSLRKF